VKPRKPEPSPKEAAPPRKYPKPSGLPPCCLPADQVPEGWGDMVILNREPV